MDDEVHMLISVYWDKDGTPNHSPLCWSSDRDKILSEREKLRNNPTHDFHDLIIWDAKSVRKYPLKPKQGN